MKNVLIIDVETNGLDPETDSVIEVGCVLWSVEFDTILECYSGLVRADDNQAYRVNRIPPKAIRAAAKPIAVWESIRAFADECEAYVAHNARFDESFCRPYLEDEKPWICTIEDFEWPEELIGKSLIAVALTHGVGVTMAHRAISDCLLLAQLFERIDDSSDRLRNAFEHAKLPKGRVVADVSYEKRQLAKDAGFFWDGDQKQWYRYMALEEAKALPFKTRVTE